MKYGLSEARSSIKMKVAIFKNQSFFVQDINARVPNIKGFNSNFTLIIPIVNLNENSKLFIYFINHFLRNLL